MKTQVAVQLTASFMSHQRVDFLRDPSLCEATALRASHAAHVGCQRQGLGLRAGKSWVGTSLPPTSSVDDLGRVT